MGDSSQVESRAWRLALLITGEPALADKAVIAMHRRRARVETLPHARLDRLTLICVREILGHTAPARLSFLNRLRETHRESRGVAPATDEAPPESPFEGAGLRAIGAALNLRLQPREAWVLHRIFNLDLRGTAQSMDCSRTAAARHLEEAESAMARVLADNYVKAIESLRAQSQAAEPGPGAVREMRRGRRQRRADLILKMTLRILAGAIILAVVGWVILRIIRTVG